MVPSLLKCFSAALATNTICKSRVTVIYQNRLLMKIWELNLLYSCCLKTKKKGLGKSLEKVNNTVLQMFIRSSSWARWKNYICLIIKQTTTSLQLWHIRLLSRLVRSNRWETSIQNEDCITPCCLPGSLKCPFLKHLLRSILVPILTEPLARGWGSPLSVWNASALP